MLALAIVREGDTLVVPKLGRLAWFVPDACTKERLHCKQSQLSGGQQRELCRMPAMGTSSISSLPKLFSTSKPTLYHTLDRRHSL